MSKKYAKIVECGDSLNNPGKIAYLGTENGENWSEAASKGRLCFAYLGPKKAPDLPEGEKWKCPQNECAEFTYNQDKCSEIVCPAYEMEFVDSSKCNTI